MEVFVKNWKGSIPQSVAIATVKTRQNVLHLWLLTAYEVFLSFFQYSRCYGQNDISSVFTLAVLTSYDLHLHVKMAASISQVFSTLNANVLRTRSDIEKRSRVFFPILSDLSSEINMFCGWTFTLISCKISFFKNFISSHYNAKYIKLICSAPAMYLTVK